MLPLCIDYVIALLPPSSNYSLLFTQFVYLDGNQVSSNQISLLILYGKVVIIKSKDQLRQPNTSQQEENMTLFQKLFLFLFLQVPSTLVFIVSHTLKVF